MGHAKDYTGKRLGSLVVLRPIVERHEHGGRQWLVACDCGAEKILSTNAFGSNRSCGCQSPKHPNYIRKEITGTVYADLRDKHRNRTGSEAGLISIQTCRSLIMMACHYCGAPPSNTRKGMCYQGIDRIDNSRGYIDGNCIPCCQMCNFFKHKHGQDVFLNHVRAIAVHQGWCE